MSVIPSKESLVVEFKSEWNSKNDGTNIKKTIVAFANTAGGDLYLGVGDDGSIVGVHDADALEERISCTIRDNIQPSLASFVTTEQIRIQGKTVLRVHVDAGSQKPYYLDAKNAASIFVRMNNASFPASIDEIAAMVRSSNPIAFENRISFEQNLTFNHCMRFCQERGLEFDPKAHLGFGFWDRKRQAYTNLAFLCSDQSDYSEVLIQFADDEKLQVLQAQRVSGSIFELYEEAVAFINRTNYAWLEKPNEGNAERIDHYLIEPRVILEAVVNMLAHRNYARKTANLIHVTPSKVELSSVGGLVEGLSLEDIAERMNTECRNSGLARLFSELRLMENIGSGFRRIRSFYRGRPIDELLDVTESSFTIKLPRLMSNAWTNRPEFRDVLSVIGQHGSASRKEIQDALNWSQTRTINLLSEMVKNNFLEKSGGSRSTKYKIRNS